MVIPACFLLGIAFVMYHTSEDSPRGQYSELIAAGKKVRSDEITEMDARISALIEKVGLLRAGGEAVLDLSKFKDPEAVDARQRLENKVRAPLVLREFFHSLAEPRPAHT